MGGCLDLPGVLTFAHNRQLVRATADTASGIEAAKWADTGTLDVNAPKLDAAQEQLRQLADWNENGAPVQMRWGMYEGRELYGGTPGRLLRPAVSRAVVERAFGDLDDRLRAMDTGPMRTSENFNRDFDTLKLYLDARGPLEDGPDLGGSARLVQGWHLTSHARVKDEERLVLPARGVRARAPSEGGRSSPGRVTRRWSARARSILSQVPQVERCSTSALVRDANVEIAPIRRETIFYGAVAPFVQSRKQVKVDGAYTKAWMGSACARFSESSEAKLAAEQWVLGDRGRHERARGGGQAPQSLLRALQDRLARLLRRPPGAGPGQCGPRDRRAASAE